MFRDTGCFAQRQVTAAKKTAFLSLLVVTGPPVTAVFLQTTTNQRKILGPQVFRTMFIEIFIKHLVSLPNLRDAPTVWGSGSRRKSKASHSDTWWENEKLQTS